MATEKISFGQANMEIDARIDEERESYLKKHTTTDVQLFEMRLQQESEAVARDATTPTFYRDRLEQRVKAFTISHDRGDFALPEEMSRAEFVTFNSTEMDPMTGVETPLADPPTSDDVFDRPEISAVTASLLAVQGDGSPQGFKSHEISEPVMWLLKRASQLGLVMGQQRGPVFDRLRPDVRMELLKQGRVSFRGETRETREVRVERLFKLANDAIAMRAELRQAATELAGAEQLGGRVVESSRPVIANAIREIEREASKLGPFARWIVQGDEMKRLREQVAPIQSENVDAETSNRSGASVSFRGR